MPENNTVNQGHLYQMLKKGDKAKVMKYCYGDNMSDDDRLKLITTVNKDTILHLAIYMGQQDIAEAILLKCSEGPDDKLLMTRNTLGNTVLHEAAATGMACLVKGLLRKAPTLLSIANKDEQMPLYTAAYYGQTDMFKLLEKEVDAHDSERLDLHLRNHVGHTILHAAILGEFFELAHYIAKRYKLSVTPKKDKFGMTGLQLLSRNPWAFRSGKQYGPIEWIIYCCAPYEKMVMDEVDSCDEQEEADKQYYSDSGDETGACCFMLLPQCQILTLLYKNTLLYMNTLRQTISSVNRSIWNVLRAWGTMKRIYEEKKRHKSAFELAKYLIASDFSWDSIAEEDGNAVITSDTPRPLDAETSQTTPPSLSQVKTNKPSTPLQLAKYPIASDFSWDSIGEEDGNAVITSDTPRPLDAETSQTTLPSLSQVKTNKPSTPLLIATKYGILEIVDEILKEFPLAVEHVSELGQNMLHVAIAHRRWDVFHRVIGMKPPKSRLVRRIDNNGFTILHQVGNMENYKGGTQSGPAFQLQEELEWFEIVEREVPPHYAMLCQNKNEIEHENEKIKKETPKEYFRCTHANLLKESQDWIKRTSESCSKVAGLIATVAFAAAFTVPGGNDQNKGTPLLLHSSFFLVFIITDALSLASSLTSLVMFLSILTSPYEIDDFRHSLPRKIIFGFTFLFFSVAVTMVAFASTLMLTISIKQRLTTTFIYCVAFLPVTMFALLQFPLLVAFKTTLKYSVQAIESVIGLPWHLISVPLSKLKKDTHKQ